MASSLLSAAYKTTLNNVFNDIHQTFGRPITIYQSAQEVVLVTNADNNFLYQQAPTNSITSTVIQSGVYLARILYGKRQTTNQFSSPGNMQNQIELSEGQVRIKMDPTGSAFLAKAERIQFDGVTYKLDSDPRYHGLFDPNFRTTYLKKVQ